jgi:hypothetical protein
MQPTLMITQDSEQSSPSLTHSILTITLPLAKHPRQTAAGDDPSVLVHQGQWQNTCWLVHAHSCWEMPAQHPPEALCPTPHIGSPTACCCRMQPSCGRAHRWRRGEGAQPGPPAR